MIRLGEHDLNLFVQPLGDDFAKAVVDGLRARSDLDRPEDIARITLVVNTSRMARRLRDLFAKGGPGFLPRIMVLGDLETLLQTPPPPLSPDPLAQRLQLAQLMAPILKQRPELGAQSTQFQLCDSLITLLNEMHREGVSSDAIAKLDVADESGHWQFAQTLIGIAQSYLSDTGVGQTAEARQRRVVMQLIDEWQSHPPTHPVILAGSTGSHGTTALLMRAMATLRTGAVILPGVDLHTPDEVWDLFADGLHGEDHPQFRIARLCRDLGTSVQDCAIWHDNQPTAQDRTRVMSLALRPAPVTDSWLREGPDLPELPEALGDVTLVEAPGRRVEAMAIAMRLREAAQNGQTAALITPDRVLTRQVAAALNRWDIEPDDSAGAPLHLSAPGRFLRHSADLLFRQIDAERLLTLLKHPLTQTGDAAPKHGLFVQLLEHRLRRDSVPYPDTTRLAQLIEIASDTIQDKADMIAWGSWLTGCLPKTPQTGSRDLASWIADHRRLSETLAAGGSAGSGTLWERNAGVTALAALDALARHADHAPPMTGTEYVQLLTSVLASEEVRDRDAPYAGVMIWGTLEARVQGADLVIMGGLNEGSWPQANVADPWLNRRMRNQVGMLSPDRSIGLAAHDFQQAFSAPEVWITRSVRSDDAETVPARWLNRLMNLLGGLPDRAGPEALQAMRDRGCAYLARVDLIEATQDAPPATRAAPKPPVAARPRDYSVTEIRTLIRDPYAIYARHVLGLRPLDPLVQLPDAPIRGIVIHDIMEQFIRDVVLDPEKLTRDHLLSVVDAVLDTRVPWPAARIMWRARMARVADWVIETERARLKRGLPAAMEDAAKGRLYLDDIGCSIRGTADRIDLTPQGGAILYDYKSGSPPSGAQQEYFEKQLLIEAAMVENGAFQAIGPRHVEDALYIGLGPSPKEEPAPLAKEPPATTLANLRKLLMVYLSPDQPFLSRRMLSSDKDTGDYDHLARFGEWEDGAEPAPEDAT